MEFIDRLKQHPKGFWFVFWGELAERASFYGMRAILAMYLFTVLGYAERSGASIVQFFIAGCYITTLAGAWVADRYLGRYKVILYFAGPYILGHLILGAIPTRWAMFTALVLLAFGSGSIKPNTSTLMGRVYEAEGKKWLLSDAFNYFYAAINIGALFSMLVLPFTRDHFGYGIAFAVPAALMAASFMVFAFGRRYYPDDKPREEMKEVHATPEAQVRTVLRILPVLALFAVYWFVYDQCGSTWIYLAKDHMNLTVFPGVTVPPDGIGWTNSVWILVLTPVMTWLWAKWGERRGGRAVLETTKIAIGFAVVLACVGILAGVGFASAVTRPSIWWEFLAYFVLTVSELCVSVVGLEFAYTQALPGTKSIVTGAFLATVAVGDFFGGFFDRLYDKTLKPGPYFLVQAGMVAVAAVAFVLIARWFNATKPGAEPEEPAIAA